MWWSPSRASRRPSLIVLLLCFTALGAGCGGAAGASSSTVASAEATPPGTASSDGESAGGDSEDPTRAVASEAEPRPAASPPAPGALPEWLDYAGVTLVSQVHRDVYGWGGGAEDVQALMYTDGAGVHVCVAVDEAEPSCWTLQAAPNYLASVDVSLLDGAARIHTSFGDEDGFVSVTVTDEELVATFGPGGQQPLRPFTDVAVMPRPPALFAALAGYELRTDGVAVMARHGDLVRVCRRGAAGYTCTAGQRFDQLGWEQLAIDQVREDYPGLVELEVSFEEQEGDVYTAGQAILYTRATDTSVSLLAYVVVSYEQRSRPSNDNDDIEVAQMEMMFDVELRQAGCVFIPPPTVARVLYRDDGSERRLRPAPLRRAPASVPAAGVDPLAVSMAGAWAIEPEGGLRRIPRCEYEDE